MDFKYPIFGLIASTFYLTAHAGQAALPASGDSYISLPSPTGTYSLHSPLVNGLSSNGYSTNGYNTLTSIDATNSVRLETSLSTSTGAPEIYSAESDLFYYIRVNSAASNAPAQIDIRSSMATTISDDSVINAGSMLAISLGYQYYVLERTHFNGAPNSIEIAQTIDIPVNTDILVRASTGASGTGYANAAAQTSINGIFIGLNSAFSADHPEYSLEISAGISNIPPVPEPTQFMLLSTGLLVLTLRHVAPRLAKSEWAPRRNPSLKLQN